MCVLVTDKTFVVIPVGSCTGVCLRFYLRRMRPGVHKVKAFESNESYILFLDTLKLLTATRRANPFNLFELRRG